MQNFAKRMIKNVVTTFLKFLWSLAYEVDFQIPNLKFSDRTKDLFVVIDVGSKQSLDQSEKSGIQLIRVMKG